MVSNSWATFIVEKENLLRNPNNTSKNGNVYKKNIFSQTTKETVHCYVPYFFKCACNEMQGIISLLPWNHMKLISMIMLATNIQKKIQHTF